MHIDPYIFSFSALTVIATIWMGFWAAKSSKTAHDFFVAGRSVSVGWNASAISGEYLSAASFMGVAGMVMSSGYDALWYPVCYACGYLFLLLFIAGPLRRFGAYTIPDFAEGRFDSPIFRKIAVVFVLFIGFFYTMPQMKGAGTTLAYIFQDVDLRGLLPNFLLNHDAGGLPAKGVPYWAGVVLVGAVITLNVALGGMKGITLVQAFQYWAKMFAISVPIFVLMSVYGHYGKQVGFNGNAPGTIVRPEAIHVGSMPDSSGRLPDQHLYVNIGGMSRGFLFWKNLWVDFRGQERRMQVSHPAGNHPVAEILEAYCQSHVWHRGLNHVSGFLAVELAGRQISYSQSRPLDRYEFDEHVRRVLETNGITLIHITPNLFKAVPTTNADKYGVAFRGIYVDIGEKELRIPDPLTQTLLERQTDRILTRVARSGTIRNPLPDKAPKDETWLNPFGPLTTKAAKAAMGTIPTDFELLAADDKVSKQIRPMSQTVYAPNLFAQIERLKNALRKPNAIQNWRTIIRPGASNVMSDIPGLLHVYRASVNRVILWQTNLEPSGRFPVEVSHTSLTTDAEFAAKMEVALRSNGVSLVSAPHTAMIAVRTSDLERIRSEAKTRREQDSGARIKAYALLYTYSLIIALVCGTAGLPHILVRFYTNPDGAAAKRTTMWVMILIGVFYLFPPVFGVMGRNLLPELYAASGAKGTDKVVLELPRILNEQKILNSQFSITNSQSSAAPPNASLRIENLELKNAPLKKGIPWGSILSGITCAGAFAAFMSTFSGLLVSMTGALAHDVYGRIFRPRSTPQQRLVAFKISAIVIGAIAILLGTQVEQLQINFMVGQAFAIAAASYFPLLFMSCWWRGMTMKGAASGMLAGGFCALLAVTLTNFSDLKWIDLANFWAAHPLTRILCEQPAIWTVPLAIGLMVFVSKLTSRQVPADIRMKMLVLHAPEQLGLKQEYIQEHQPH